MTRATPRRQYGGNWVEVDGHRLHYLTAGNGTPVILLHGGIIDSAALSWGGVIGPLAKTHRVIALDMLGYGASDAPDDVDYSTELHVDILTGVINQLSLESTDIIGLSLGGAIALGYALRSPERLENLVVVDSHGLGAPPPRRRLTYVASRLPILNRLSLALLRRNKSFVRASLRNIVHDPEAISDAVIDELFELVSQPNAGKAYRRWRRSEITWTGYRTDFTPRLSELGVPTLFVHGAEDAVFPVEYARQAAARVPTGELRVLDDCGHWPPREVPERFTETVSAYLT